MLLGAHYVELNVIFQKNMFAMEILSARLDQTIALHQKRVILQVPMSVIEILEALMSFSIKYFLHQFYISDSSISF